MRHAWPIPRPASLSARSARRSRMRVSWWRRSMAGTCMRLTRSCHARMPSISWRAGAGTGSKSASPTAASTCCTPAMWRCSGRPRRPIQSQSERAALLASLAAVDLIVVFEEDTPMELIREIRPQVLVKGDDYRLDEVVGAEFVKSGGGEVLLAKVVPGYSTTATIARLAG